MQAAHQHQKIYIPKGIAVREYAYDELINGRDYMEDGWGRHYRAILIV